MSASSTNVCTPTSLDSQNTISGRGASIVFIVLKHLSQQSLMRMPDLKAIADSLNLSPSYLRHMIKQETGISFSRQIKVLRLRRARVLLRETCWNVKEVMNQVGISDHSHFSKDYKKEFGESPTETRSKGIATRKKLTPCQEKSSLCA